MYREANTADGLDAFYLTVLACVNSDKISMQHLREKIIENDFGAL